VPNQPRYSGIYSGELKSVGIFPNMLMGFQHGFEFLPVVFRVLERGGKGVTDVNYAGPGG
jgi:hypothetical protein